MLLCKCLQRNDSLFKYYYYYYYSQKTNYFSAINIGKCREKICD